MHESEVDYYKNGLLFYGLSFTSTDGRNLCNHETNFPNANCRTSIEIPKGSIGVKHIRPYSTCKNTEDEWLLICCALYEVLSVEKYPTGTGPKGETFYIQLRYLGFPKKIIKDTKNYTTWPALAIILIGAFLLMKALG